MDKRTARRRMLQLELGVVAYIGSPCPICSHTFDSLDDIGEGRFGNVPDIVHKRCWTRYECVVGITRATVGRTFLADAEQVARSVKGSDTPIISTTYRKPDGSLWLERRAAGRAGYSLRRIPDANHR